MCICVGKDLVGRLSLSPSHCGVKQLRRRIRFESRYNPRVSVASPTPPVRTPDETGWRVAGRPAWLHAWVAARATAYAIDPHRKADVLERRIGELEKL